MRSIFRIKLKNIMEDYFHLNLKKFAAQAGRKQRDSGIETTSMPRPAAEDKAPGGAVRELALSEPVAVDDNSDPYNSTGRFNLKDADW